MAVPASLHTRLRIVPLDDEPIKKKVSFSDLNQIQKFEFNEPPILIHENNEVARLRAHIRLLESNLDRYESYPAALAHILPEQSAPTLVPTPTPTMSHVSSSGSVATPTQVAPVAPSRVPVRRLQPRQEEIQNVPQQRSATRKFFYRLFMGLAYASAAAIIPSIVFCVLMPPMGVLGLTMSIILGIACRLIAGELK